VSTVSGAASTVERSPHPWNRDFVWEDHVGPFRSVSDVQAGQYDELGWFVVEQAFDADTVARMCAELEGGDEQIRDFLGQLPDGRFHVAGLDTQVVAPHHVMRSPWLKDFCAGPVLSGICRDLIGPDVRLYWEQSVYKQPHSVEPVLWHQDNGYTFIDPQAYVTCWIALDDATVANGCISVMTGVHRDGTLAHRNTPIGFECWGDFDQAVDLPLRAGDVAVFSSLTPHATRVNTTDDVRRAYIVQYCHDGAIVLEGDPERVSDRAECRTRIQDDPTRQFLVVRDDELVGPT